MSFESVEAIPTVDRLPLQQLASRLDHTFELVTNNIYLIWEWSLPFKSVDRRFPFATMSIPMVAV